MHLRCVADEDCNISTAVRYGIGVDASYDDRPFNLHQKEVKMKKIPVSRLAMAAAAAFAVTSAGAAFAGTATATLNVTANIDASCTISATPVAFGAYNPASATAHYASGTVTVGCVKGSVPTVALDGGQNQGATVVERSMKHATAADLLSYSLFKPTAAAPNTACTNAETDAWGTDPAQRFSPTGVALTGSVYNVCGKISAGQDVSAGAYSDVVTATVEF